MLPRLGAGLTLALLWIALADRVADVAVALADAAALFGAIAELRMSICGSGIETYFRPWRPIISPCDMYLRRSFLILPTHDLAEAIKVALGAFDGHSCLGGWRIGDGGWGLEPKPLTPNPNPIP